MVKVGKCALIGLMHKKWTLRVELTKKTSHCKSRDFLRKRRLKRLIRSNGFIFNFFFQGHLKRTVLRAVELLRMSKRVTGSQITVLIPFSCPRLRVFHWFGNH